MKYYSVREVAGLLGVSTRTVDTWVTAGELRAFHVSQAGNSRKPRWRISEVALAEFTEARAKAPPQPKKKRRARQPAGEVHDYL